MHLIILGTGAGGGCPQWNCGCENCNFARKNPESARTTDSLAIEYEEDGETAWAIVNPGVDLRHQLARHREFQPKDIRKTPIRSVILTDAELDHTMGLINLREGAHLKVFATAAAFDLLKSVFPVTELLQRYANLELRRIEPGVPFYLGEETCENVVKVTAVGVSARQPRYAKESDEEETSAQALDAVVGLRFESVASAGAVAYAPQIGAWSPEIIQLLANAEIQLVDGTFYTSDELQCLGIKAGSAKDMGHLPISGENGILSHLKETKASLKLLTHINNTNPILRDNSTERLAVENAGVKVAMDGMSISTNGVGEKRRD